MFKSQKHLRARFACVALSISLLAGCATGTHPSDPFEGFNRGVYAFNENLDRAILKPVARGYRAVLPEFLRASVSNFFSNINDVVVALNNLLQGKFTAAYSDLGRVAINTTLGVLGLFDVASEAGIEKHEEDFGQTLAKWGIGDGPYLMLPLLGPSTGRDAVGRVVDYAADPITYVDPTRASNQLYGTRLVNRRAELLDASTVLQTAALDPYEFVRDAYLQRRRSLIYDGSPPADREFLDSPPVAPKPQGAGPRQPAFPTAAEPTSYGSVLVSGESSIPVTSTYARPSLPAPIVQAKPAGPATTGRAAARPVLTRTDGSGVYAGEPLTAAQWETLQPGQMTIAGAAPSAHRELPRLTQLWKALQLER